MTRTRYMDLINCSTPEEVYVRVREWSSDLTEQEHIVRSTILDIHADIERSSQASPVPILGELDIQWR
jgi:hypothetical protein